MKKFEEHLLAKYPGYKWGEITSEETRKYIDHMNDLIQIESVKRVYHNDKASFMAEVVYLLKDNEITMTMAVEMEPYQLAILRLNPYIDNQTRLYAELNWS
jgi:diphthamide synthase (EF-2-diphthine--ammonia ligase)